MNLNEVVTDALMGMIAAITGTTPPAGQPPQFIQAAIDRATDRINAGLLARQAEQAPACWAPSAALEKLRSGCNNSQCVLTDGPAEFNDTPLFTASQAAALHGAKVVRISGSMSVEKFTGLLSALAEGGADDDIPDFHGGGNKAQRRMMALHADCLPVPRWACESLLSTKASPWRVNAETAVSELLRGVVPTEPADHDAPRQVRLLLAEVARLRALLPDGIDSEGGSCD